jgi:hypothetical protein
MLSGSYRSPFNVNHWSIWNILHKNLLYPYHIQRVQSLTQEDYPRRQNFCEWLLQENDQNPMFVSKILMTDECCFTRNGILTFIIHITGQMQTHIEFAKQIFSIGLQ